jgi:CO dehydrogenase maturation factor
MKIAISGKGGVGKTTVAAMLCQVLAWQGVNVLAVDADPDANLGMALEFDADLLAQVITIAQDEKLIAERTGATPGSRGEWFTLNPGVEDIPDKYIIKQGNISLLQMGAKAVGGSGCACPESVLLQSLLNHLVIDIDQAVIVDMEAGLEHLGRGTACGVDAFIIVVEPGQRSLATARTIVKMVQDLGVRQVYAVLSKWQGINQACIADQLAGLEILGVIPYKIEAVLADWQGGSLLHSCPELLKEVEHIVDVLAMRRQVR